MTPRASMRRFSLHSRVGGTSFDDTFVCFRDAQGGSDAGVRLLRRFDEAGSLLRGIGVILRRLQGIEAVTALARASNAEPTPSKNGLRLPKEVIA
jgi:hypothetical protein